MTILVIYGKIKILCIVRKCGKMSKIYDLKNTIKYNELIHIVNIIKQDGIVVFPIEIVYRIGGKIKILREEDNIKGDVFENG